MTQDWARYDKWGFSVAWCERKGEPGNGYYWHARHPKYGVRWGHAASKRDAHHQANWAIGDMRQGVP